MPPSTAPDATSSVVVREDAFARISICDEGIGIDPADHERIFADSSGASPGENFGGLG